MHLFGEGESIFLNVEKGKDSFIRRSCCQELVVSWIDDLSLLGPNDSWKAAVASLKGQQILETDCDPQTEHR